MNTFRKLIALFIIVFIGIPILFGVIWAVGITRAALHPEFVSELPKEIFAETIEMVEDFFIEVDNNEIYMDQNSKEWITAIKKVEMTPRELMHEIGLMGWLENEVSDSIKQVGDILKGEGSLEEVEIDMVPLKNALTHQAISDYIKEILGNLPPCNEDQARQWLEIKPYDDPFSDLPACRPANLDEALEIIGIVTKEEIDDIPDSIEIFEWSPFFPEEAYRAGRLLPVIYLLFLIPALFIGLGSLIASNSLPKFLKWFGVSTFIGGALTFGIISMGRHIFPWALQFAPESHAFTNIEDFFIIRGGDLMSTVFEKLFSPVVSVSGTVCVVGIILFALSYAVNTRSDADSHPEEIKEQSSEITSDSQETGE